MKKKSNKQLAKEILNREIAALKRTTKLLDSKFERACDAIISNKGKVITLGVGKSSFIAMNIAMHPRVNPMKYPIVAFIFLLLKL